MGAGEFLHKLNIPEFHNEPTLVGAEEPADFRLTDWLPESGARQHLNGCHCHLKISARATLSLNMRSTACCPEEPFSAVGCGAFPGAPLKVSRQSRAA
jgi:hypothetical protein